MSRVRLVRLAPCLLALVGSPLSAQWANRYLKIQGYNHHVYLEGYEFPTMNVGPTDPAFSPDGRGMPETCHATIRDQGTAREAALAGAAGAGIFVGRFPQNPGGPTCTRPARPPPPKPT